MALKHRKQFPAHFNGAVIYWITNDEWQQKGAGPSALGSADAVEAKARCTAEGRVWERSKDCYCMVLGEHHHLQRPIPSHTLLPHHSVYDL